MDSRADHRKSPRPLMDQRGQAIDLYDQALTLPGSLPGTAVPVSHRQLRHQGLSATALRWRAQRGRLVRLHQGVYLRPEDPADLLDRVRAALLVAPPLAVVGFHTAAALLGFGVVRSAAVHLVVPAGTPFPQRPGIAAHQSAAPIGDPWLVRGVPCIPPDRCAVDLARVVRRLDAIAVLDAALRTGACSPDSLRLEAARHRRLRGVRQARQLVRLADARPECRQESQLRLLLHDAGVGGFVPQLVVGDGTGARYRLELGDPERRVGVEYDGVSHLDRARLRHDRQRHNRLSAHGWRLRYFTDHDLYHRPDRIIQVVKDAQRRSSPSR